MTSRRSFYLKIAYLVVIGVLLLPLSFLSQPASSRAKGDGGSPGGYLARLRAEYDLSEAELGEIDPTSETIKLATFGLRGVATNILWEKANRYDKKKDWTNLSATLKQIAKLEPHFIAVWRFQAWRVSYNVSAEFDDYRGRYRWVIRGIDFLNEGIRYNEREPVLYWDVGWFTAQKIGRADESKQFRKLFKEDDDFHGSRPPEFRDNWLVGKEAFTEAEALVAGGSSLKKMSPVLFYSERPMCQMNYAETLEEDGSFREKARRAWETAGREWHDYGDRDIPTSFGLVIRLNDRGEHMEQAQELRAELDAMTPGLREKVAREQTDQLSEEDREVLDVPFDERTEEQHNQTMMIQRRLRITHEQVANQLTGAERSRAVELAKMLTEAEEMANVIRRYQEIVNFEYWDRRAAIEQTEQARAAREFIYDGRQAFVEATDLGLAKAKYEDGLAKWRELLDLDQFENLVEDASLGRDLIETIDLYRKILDARDEPFPEDFILQDVLDLHQERFSEPEEEPPPEEAEA
jgi:hypothetical protein